MPPAPTLRVLVVEDDPDDHILTLALLGEIDQWQAEVVWVRDVPEAIETVCGSTFDVALVDYTLGARSGVEFLRSDQVRASGTPVIVLTGSGREADLEAAAAGAADFLNKREVTATTLERAIRYAVESAQRIRAERRFRAFIEHARDAVAVLDRDRIFRWAAGPAAAALGVGPEGLVGQRLDDFAAGADDREGLRAAFARAIEAPEGQILDVQVRVRWSDGSVHDVEFSLSGRLDDPAIQGVGLTARDVTERTMRERKMGLQAELLDRVGTAVFALDGERRVTYWNRAAEKTFGWTWAEVRGRQIGEWVTSPEHEAEIEAIRTTVDRLGAWEGETRLRHKDGREIAFLGSLVATGDSGGERDGRIAAGVDVSELRRAQKQLGEQRELVSRVVASAPILLYAIDGAGRITLSEGEGLRTLGLEPGQVVGRSIFELYGDRPEIVADIRKALSGETFHTVRESDGLVFETWWSPLADGSGTIAVSVDVTGRRKAEEEQERLLALIDATPDFVGIATADRRILHLNPAGRRMVGLAPDFDVTRLTIPDLHPGWALERLEREGLPAALGEGSWAGESAILSRDGHETPVWQLIVAHPSEDGAVGFLSTVASDLTERNQAAARINFQATLLDAVGQAVIATDLDGRVTYWNRAAEDLYGWTAPEAMERDILDLTPAEPSRPLAEDVMKTMSRGGSFSGEFRVRRKDGTEFTALVTTAPLCDAGGDRVGFVGVSSDVSGIKELEAELRQAQKLEAVGRLAGGVAHDFNNLLTGIQVHVELMLRDVGADAAISDDLREVERAARRAADLTRQLLAFSRKQLFEERVVDLCKEVADNAGMLRRLVPENIDLDVSTGGGPVLVRADPTQLQQVLLNLVVNAVDAIEGTGTLEVRVGAEQVDANDVEGLAWDVREGLYAALTVRDSGVGMTPDVKERIFEPFFTTKDLGKGTGLGLASVFGIVKQSGGHVLVDSTPGKGATFKILLPAQGALDREPEPSAPRETRAPAPPDDSATVLLVEDDATVRRVARRVLERAGYTVLVAEDGRVALDLARSLDRPIDLVLSDVVMPEMGGAELVRHLRELFPTLRVVLTSGYSRDELAGGVAELGVGFLGKPFTTDELLQTVRSVLAETPGEGS